MIIVITALFLVTAFIIYHTVVIVPMHASYVVERLGKFRVTLMPGIHFLIPFFDSIAYEHEMREQVLDIPSQSCISQDNIQVEVDGIVYLKVTDPRKASYGIGDYKVAAVNLAQTTMRSEVGKLSLGKTFSERDAINEKIVKEIDIASNPWGIKVLRYEIMNIIPSQGVVTTLEKQMEAERNKRAEITMAEATREARINLSEGHRQESINLSLGERQKRINLAQGKAAEISLIAEASAKGIALIGAATKEPSGNIALKSQLLEQFIEEFGNILDNSNLSILPNEMANIKGVFEGFEQVSKNINVKGKA